MINFWADVRSLFTRLKQPIITLNLFDTQSTDPQIIKLERWSTRIYLLLLCFTLTSFISYTATRVQVITNTVHTPSLTKYLDLYYSPYSTTLTCPCSSITINHKNFIQVNYTLHPVCSSEYILNKSFRESLFVNGFSNRTDYQMIWPMDVRKSFTPYLSLLASLCSLSTSTLDDAINQFAMQSIITSEIISPNALDFEILSRLNHMRNQAPTSLLNSLYTVQSITAGNQIVSGWSTNYVYDLRYEEYSTIAYSSLSDIHSWCDCISAQKCPVPIGIYDYPTWDTHGYYNLSELQANKTMVGLFSDCLPLDGILISSLYCLYNLLCIKALGNSFNLLMPPPLNESYLKSFQINDTIQTLLERLFVDEWQNTSSYSNFFQTCAPTYCSYSFPKYHNVFVTFNKALGIIGGLTVALRIIVFFLVKNIMKILSKQNSLTTRNRHYSTIFRREFFYNKITVIWKVLVELNLFDKNDSGDTRNVRSERISTRVYLSLLSLSLIILVFYVGFSSQTITLTINNPSLDEYERLYVKYRSTLSCPCSYISTTNGQFINISFTLHPICLSNILSLNWNSSMTGIKIIHRNYYAGFRNSVASHFRLIDNLCSFARLAIDKAFVSFSLGEFVSNHLIDRQSFEVQAASLVHTFIDTTAADFFTSIQILREIDQGNQPQTTSMTNARLILNADTSIKTLLIYSQNGDTFCSCYTTNECTSPQFLQQGNSLNTRVTYLPGLVIGCSQLESVLRSTLECWFDQICLELIIRYILEKTLEEANVTQLDASDMNSMQQFTVDTTFETLLKSMLVNTWQNTTIYQSFYSACSPSSCTYSFVEKNSLLYIIITIFSLIGGLTKVFRFIVPLLVKIVLKCIEKPQSIESQTHSFRKYTLHKNTGNFKRIHKFHYTD